MKKKIKIIAVFTAVSAFTAPAFSIVQVGAQGNYSSISYAQGLDTQKYAGMGFGAYARFTAGIPLLVTFAAGPYLDYATLTKSSGSPANGDMKNLRAGGEVAIYLDVLGNVIGVTPYGRIGFGYEGNTVKTTYTVTGTVTATADAFYYGTSGHTIFGLTLKVLPLIYIYAEGGPLWNSLKAQIPAELSSTISASDVNSTGWRASLGAMIWL
jgi:hypothetical protein